MQIRLLNLNEEINIACSSALTARNSPKQIQPLDLKFPAGRECHLFDFFQRHPCVLQIDLGAL